MEDRASIEVEFELEVGFLAADLPLVQGGRRLMNTFKDGEGPDW